MASQSAFERRPDDPEDTRRLAMLLDVAQDFGRLGVWERDAVTGAGSWAPRMFDLFGLPAAAQAPTLDAAYALLSPPDRVPARAAYERSLRHPGRHEARYSVHRPDGSIAYLHSIWQVPAQGSRILGVVIDDTAAVAEARRHAVTRTHLALISQLAGVSLWRTDVASQRIFRGEQVWHATALDPGTEGLPLAEFRTLVHPDDLAAVEQAHGRALQGIDSPDIEVRVRAPDGRYHTMLTRRVAQRDEAGHAVAVLGVGVDISEQVQARERYRRLLDQFHMVVESTGIGVWMHDLDTGEREWNEAMRSLYGLAPTDPLPALDGDVVSDAVLPEDRPRLRAAMRELLVPAAPRIEVGFRIRRRDGQQRAMVGRAQRLERRLYGIAIDVTELQAAQRAVREKEAAEQSSRAKSAFLSRMSHELRTPLNAMLGFGALLLDDPAAPPSPLQRERLIQVLDAGQHLLGLVNDMLELGQTPPASPGSADERTDLSAVIESVVDGMVDSGRQARVQISVSGSCPAVLGAERQWRQVVSNLLSNAVKYNRPGGFVQVALSETSDPAWARLEIRDSGRGLDAEQQLHLFEPFNRLGAERDGIPGAGLGLTVARQLVQALGGELEFSSEPGVGTLVRVRARQAAEPDDAPPPAGLVQPQRLDVVYVEDNAVNVLLVREILSQRPQLRLQVAGTLAEALALVPAVQPALLLVDMHLPDGDGHELLQQLRAGGQRPARHCIALSADVMPQEIARARAGGFDDYWAKPIDVPAFLEAVDRLLGASG